MTLEQEQLQAQEAKARREGLAHKYSVTSEEAAQFNGRIKRAIAALGDHPDPESIVQALDHSFNPAIPRELELRNAYTDSSLGKISESIRHYLPLEAQRELLPLLNTISTQMHGRERKFNSVSEVYAELRKYEHIFKKYGLDFGELSQRFLDELSEYLK